MKAAPIAIPVSTFSWLCAGVTYAPCFCPACRYSPPAAQAQACIHDCRRFSVGLWPALHYAGPFALVSVLLPQQGPVLYCSTNMQGMSNLDGLHMQAAIFMGLLMAHHLLPSAWKRALLSSA